MYHHTQKASVLYFLENSSNKPHINQEALPRDNLNHYLANISHCLLAEREFPFLHHTEEHRVWIKSKYSTIHANKCNPRIFPLAGSVTCPLEIGLIWKQLILSVPGEDCSNTHIDQFEG